MFDAKLNGVNCRRLIKHHIDVINGIKDIFIEGNKDIVSDDEIYLVTNTYKTLLSEIDEGYRCTRSLIVDDNLIGKLEFIFKKQCLCREN